MRTLNDIQKWLEEPKNDWGYRGGGVARCPARRGGQWRWEFAGVGGWANTEIQAREKIDKVIAAAELVLTYEKAKKQ